MLKYKIPQIVTLTRKRHCNVKKDGSEKEADEMHGHKKRSTAVLQPLLTLNLIL